MRVLVINGHPGKESLSTALADQYVKGARDAGMEVRVINVRELEFKPAIGTGMERPIFISVFSAVLMFY